MVQYGDYDLGLYLQYVISTFQNLINKMMYFSFMRYLYLLLIISVVSAWIIIFVKKRSE